MILVPMGTPSVKVVRALSLWKAIDHAIQVCGGAGGSQDFIWRVRVRSTRVLRLADGLDVVRRRTGT
jgi:hypothetical protein